MKRHLLHWALRGVVACGGFAYAASGHALDEVVTDAGDSGGANQLRAKINAVQAAGGGAITFAIGSTPILLNGTALPDVTTTVVIDGGGGVTISGGNASRFLRVLSTGTVTLRGLTLTKGFHNGDGGALRNEGSAEIENCRFIENEAGGTFSGGAIISLGRLIIRNSEFTGNKAVGGGAIYPRFAAAQTTITGCTFRNNQATGGPSNGWGGALLLWDGAVVSMGDSTLADNRAHDGGAVHVRPNSSLFVGTSTFTGNQARGSGGAIQNFEETRIGSSTLSGNIAATDGGAISSSRSDKVSSVLGVTNTTLSGNSSAQFGGGIATDSAETLLVNVTLSGNKALVGSGISVGATSTTSNSTATISNSTFSDNSASGAGGGALHMATGTATVKNTIFARNSDGGNCRLDTPIVSSFNLSDDGTCGFGSGRDNVNLLLGPLADNGGGMQTHLPQPGSPAIDNGTGSDAPSIDQRILPRPQGVAVDVGALEVQPTNLANISTRLRAETGDNVLIGGFIVTGTFPKSLIARAIGPSLPFSGTLADPQLQIFDSDGKLIGSNDNWQDAPNRAAIVDSTIAPSHPLESAFLGELAPGAYTAVVSGVADGTGISLIEVYELSRLGTSKLANISTRGLVQKGDDVMIGGFILVGDTGRKVIIRGIGPSLDVAGKLLDPQLELFNADGTLLQANNNWRDTQESEINATTIPPSNNLEAAIVATLPAGSYTAVLRGADGGTGVALIEVYALD